jgi:hypothetical protein
MTRLILKAIVFMRSPCASKDPAIVRREAEGRSPGFIYHQSIATPFQQLRRLGDVDGHPAPR